MGEADLDAALTTMASALQSETQNIVVAAKVPFQEVRELVKQGVIDIELLDDVSRAGKHLQVFKVTDSIQGSPEYLIYPATIYGSSQMLLPETGTPDFTPPGGTQWMMVVGYVGEAAGPFAKIELPDLYNGLFSYKADNRLNVDLDKLMSDLKALGKQGDGSADALQTGMAKALLDKLKATE